MSHISKYMESNNREQLEQNNINRLASLMKTILFIDLGLLFTSDIYNYFNGLWQSFPYQYYAFINHLVSIPIVVFLYWMNKRYLSESTKKISHNALILLNIVLILPPLLLYHYFDVKYYMSTGIFLIYLFAVGYTIRVRGSAFILLCLHFALIYFGMILYHGISYTDNPSIYLNGIAAIAVYYFTSVKIFELEIESIDNKSAVYSKNIELKNLNSELRTSNEHLNTELKGKLLQLLQGNTIMNKLMETVNSKGDNELELNHLKELLREYNNTYHAEHIENRFLDAHSKFIKVLTALHPDLSLNNIKLSILIKIGMTSKEIAQIRSVSPSSVQVAKTRLRKQLNISEGSMKLFAYFNNIEDNSYAEVLKIY